MIGSNSETYIIKDGPDLWVYPKFPECKNI